MGRPAGRPFSFPSWSAAGPPAALVALALVIRVLAIGLDSGYEPLQDASDYDRHARSIAAGDGYPDSFIVPDGGPSALRAPGYPFALAGVYATLGADVGTGRLFGALLGAATVLLLYLLTRRIWGRRVALLAAALAAVFPPLVGLSTELYSENLFIPLLLAALLCVLRFRESGSLRWAVAAGILAGLVALTRGPGVIALLPLLFGLLSVRPRFGVRALAAPAAGLACAALVMAPWAVRNASEFGRFIPISTSGGFALAGTYNATAREDPADPTSWRNPITDPSYAPLFTSPGVDEGTLDVTLRREALGFAGDRPGYVAEVVAHNLLRLLLVEGDSVVAYGEELGGEGIGNRGGALEGVALALASALALVGAGTLLRGRTGRIRRVPRGPLFLWLIPVALLAAAALVAGLPRYRVPADPFLLILAAVGIAALIDSRRPAIPASATATGLALILAGCGGGDEGASPSSAEPSAAKSAYIERADTICARAIRDTRRIVDEYGSSSPEGSVLQANTEGLIAPGIESRARQAMSLRALEPPGPDPDLEAFIGLFDPIEELSRVRLEAGRRGDEEASARLDLLLGALAQEQIEVARTYGFEECSTDVLAAAFR